jgi:hypothetical protein
MVLVLNILDLELQGRYSLLEGMEITKTDNKLLMIAITIKQSE